jgi:hypothetical protein
MRPIAILTAAALAAATLGAPVLAQQGQPETRRSHTTPASSQSAAQPHLITIDFKGGTLEQLVDALKEASPVRPVNIIYNAEAADIAIPPFEVADADLGSTLQSLAYSSAGSPVTLGAGRMVRWQIHLVGDGVYAVQFDNTPQYISTSRGQMLMGQSLHSTAVHTITELITGTGAMSADDVLSAIQAALAIEGADDETKIRYHEETGLIFARVTPDQGSVIEQTLMNLRRSMEARERSDRRSQIQQVLDLTNTKTTEELVARVNSADELRGRVLELQRTIGELENLVINLKTELDRRSAESPDKGGN